MASLRPPRPPRPSASSFAIGGLLAVIAVVLTFASITSSSTPSTATASGCNTEETEPAPDGALPDCKSGPFIFCPNSVTPCQPVDVTVPGCDTIDGTGVLLSKLPRNRYPLGTIVNFVGSRDAQGNCNLDAVCKCIVGLLTPPTFNDPDAAANDDAGPKPVPDAGAQGPVWSCYP